MNITNLWNAFVDVLLIPVKLIGSLISFAILIMEFGMFLISYVWEFLSIVYNIVPNFLKPFILIIAGIKIFKYVTKRAISSYRSNQVQTTFTKNETTTISGDGLPVNTTSWTKSSRGNKPII